MTTDINTCPTCGEPGMTMQQYVQEAKHGFVVYAEKSPKLLVQTCAKCGEQLLPGTMLGFLELYSAAHHLRNDPADANMGDTVKFARKALGYTREIFADKLSNTQASNSTAMDGTANEYTEDGIVRWEQNIDPIYRIERLAIVALLDEKREDLAKKL